MEIPVQCLAQGEAEGPLTVLDSPLSFWGGFDVASGTIIDRSHAQCGETLTGRILLMPSGRGSSSASSVLAEALRVGTAPLGLILLEADSIITVGAIVAHKLYGKVCPVVVCSRPDFARLAQSERAHILAREGMPALVRIVD